MREFNKMEESCAGIGEFGVAHSCEDLEGAEISLRWAQAWAVWLGNGKRS